MECTAPDRSSRLLVEAACAAREISTWQDAVLETLQEVGYDVAFLKTVAGGFSFASRGFEEAVLGRARSRWSIYSRELTPVTLAAQRNGVAVDAEILGAARLRMTYHRDLVRPQNGTCGLYAHLAAGGRDVGGLMLGRAGGVFKPAEQRRVRELLAPIALGAAVMTLHVDGGPSCLWPAPSPRERDVLGLIQLGYTNPEIARALGTSPNTVRNQVSSLLRKVGASTRSELVSLTLHR